MLLIHCPDCGERHLVGNRSILAVTNTDHGPESLVRCLRGHLVLWDARTDTTGSAAPAAVGVAA